MLVDLDFIWKKKVDVESSILIYVWKCFKEIIFCLENDLSRFWNGFGFIVENEAS